MVPTIILVEGITILTVLGFTKKATVLAIIGIVNVETQDVIDSSTIRMGEYLKSRVLSALVRFPILLA